MPNSMLTLLFFFLFIILIGRKPFYCCSVPMTISCIFRRHRKFGALVDILKEKEEWQAYPEFNEYLSDMKVTKPTLHMISLQSALLSFKKNLEQ